VQRRNVNIARENRGLAQKQ